MRLSVLGNSKQGLARGVAFLMIGGLAAGCSTARFTDGVTTASTAPAQPRVSRQAEPDLIAPDRTYAAGNQGVQRSSLPQVAGTNVSNAPFQRAEAAADEAVSDVAQPVERAAERVEQTAAPVRQAAIDPMSSATERAGDITNSIARKDPAGWSSANGVRVPAKSGETLSKLSQRYGVPSKVLAQVNGLDASTPLQAGQKIIIPSYSGAAKAEAVESAGEPKVAEAKSARDLQPKELTAPKNVAAATPDKPKIKGSYVVAPGDTLGGIAYRSGVSASAIKAANNMESENVRLGQKLTIPAAGTPVVAKAETEDKPTKKGAAAKALTEKPTKAEAKAMAAAEKPKSSKLAAAEQKLGEVDPTKTASTGPSKKAQLAVADKPEEAEVTQAAYTPPEQKSAVKAAVEDDSASDGKLRWPVKGRVVSNYGKGTGSSRDGIDIQVPEGTPVKAADAGVVIYAGSGLKDFGNTVLVKHSNGLVTVYGHADKLDVKRGQTVKRGEQLATSGMSGDASAPKLHFEVRKDASPVDPSTYLQ